MSVIFFLYQAGLPTTCMLYVITDQPLEMMRIEISTVHLWSLHARNRLLDNSADARNRLLDKSATLGADFWTKARTLGQR